MRGGQLQEKRRRVLDGESRKRHDVLARQAQGRAARRENVEIPDAAEQRGHLRGGRREVLEVVEDEERPGAAERAREQVVERVPRRLP